MTKETTVAARGRGRPSLFGENKKLIAAQLLQLDKEDFSLSRYHMKSLEKAGYLEAVKGEKPAGSRGRHPIKFVLTKQGKQLCNTARNFWAMGNNMVQEKQEPEQQVQE